MDRPDFIEGQIDALEALRGLVEDIHSLRYDPRFVELVSALDATFGGNSPLEQFAAELENLAWDVEQKVDSELQHARWKLARVNGEVTS